MSSAIPVLPRGVWLARCAVRGRDFLQGPERAVALDPIAVAILREVDGARPISEIAARLAARFGAPEGRVSRDVARFLGELAAARLVDGTPPVAPQGPTGLAPALDDGAAREDDARPAPPIALLAEVTHRCPLSCLYCSNPLELTRRSAELPTEAWANVFNEAAALGVLQLHLSGGEPAARADLPELVAAARRAGLYVNLITSGVGLRAEVFHACVEAGLDHVQLSAQGADEATVTRVADVSGGLKAKAALAERVSAAGLPLTLNAVVHRLNLGQLQALFDLALAWGARRIEIAHTQYHGWAAQNRGALLPTAEQVRAASEFVAERRAALFGRLAVDHVKPDHFERFPKACMGGWGRVGLVVSPSGKVLPCHAAETLPGLSFETVGDRPLGDIWRDGAAFQAYRGTGWMPEPCASCPRKRIDFGGCRCQAFALTGDPRATDPVCEKVGGVAHEPAKPAPPRYRSFAPARVD